VEDRPLKVPSTLVLTFAIVCGLVLIGAAASDSDQSQSRVQQGLHISPVPLNLEGKNHARVGLGSYLVNAVGSCNDCHTCPSFTPGHNPYFGQPKPWVNGENFLAGGVHFGPFTSANLTPDSNGLPAGLTLKEFIQVIRTGHDPDPQAGHPPLLQVMPWPILSNMTDHDLSAIYAYLTAIPSAQPGTCGGPSE